MRIKYFIPLLILSSCDKQPKCSDPKVKELALENFIKKAKPIIIDNYIKDHLNYEDLKDYAQTNGYSYDEILEKEKIKLKDEAEIDAINTFKDIKLEDILTSKIEKEIKKCDCEASIKGKSINEIEAYYSAQLNDEEKLHVELLYKVKQ